MTGTFFFIILPVLALVSFIAGNIYRYAYRGFQVSSLSSQLLESNLLFFGSRPFHWGIVALFFGHLIGFLIPSGVLAWNAKPLRLYILESVALGFALMTLAGLGVLIYRRIKVKRIKLVTSKMDILIYFLLLMAVITGIYTAFFFSWGSSWYAVVMTPYLRSIILLKPELVAVLELPFMVKLHIVNAFIIIGIFPYTRFVHMLVYPFQYFGREYQVAIWNKRKVQDKTSI